MAAQCHPSAIQFIRQTTIIRQDSFYSTNQMDKFLSYKRFFLIDKIIKLRSIVEFL